MKCEPKMKQLQRQVLVRLFPSCLHLVYRLYSMGHFLYLNSVQHIGVMCSIGQYLFCSVVDRWSNVELVAQNLGRYLT